MEMTLDQMGLKLALESRWVPKEKHASFEDLMRMLRTPVGDLGKRRKI
jgi:hypothetical protein